MRFGVIPNRIGNGGERFLGDGLPGGEAVEFGLGEKRWRGKHGLEQLADGVRRSLIEFRSPWFRSVARDREQNDSVEPNGGPPVGKRGRGYALESQGFEEFREPRLFGDGWAGEFWSHSGLLPCAPIFTKGGDVNRVWLSGPLRPGGRPEPTLRSHDRTRINPALSPA